MRRILLYILFLTPFFGAAQSANSAHPDPAVPGSAPPRFRNTLPVSNHSGLWHDIERTLRYRPEGEDFVIVNGERRFNRALYGTHTAFRVEGGDKPEFALYMPGMGGNLKFGLIKGGNSKWLIDAQSIRMAYRPGALLYDIKDPLLGEGVLHLTILALAASEGVIVQYRPEGIGQGVDLLCAFGGATGKKFPRDGDIGADPESSFYLKPGYCAGNRFVIDGNRFTLSYGSNKTLAGTFPASSRMVIADATKQASPLELTRSAGNNDAPLIMTLLPAGTSDEYFLIRNPAGGSDSVLTLRDLFMQAEDAREKLAGRIVVRTPDPFLNTLGGALSVAADAIWEAPSYLHGAVAWRMRLPGWRGPYAADPLGWHDRARMHFSGYAQSQLTNPENGPVVFDTALHLARQLEKTGTAMFSEGYICRNPGGDFRPNHYDMNLVYIDELLDHFNWTGDTAYVKQMWPVLKRHLAWEKRNFDPDDDGLYDAYCCIWASDALQYSGGGVTHSSAYNYRSNRLAAGLARLIGEDPAPYEAEANKIIHAINTRLWMPGKGWYAEYLDRPVKGKTILHPSAGLWTIYHSIDSQVPDALQAWQSLRYVDTHIPHIPVRAKGLTDSSLYTLSTTDWLPYAWSLNNVVLAESLHTALAYWQGGRPDAAFPVWKGALVESMYLGACPGNFQQLSFYDAMKGELYRDFADPIGVAARSLVEGLFGIVPDALHDTLSIKPGWPMEWPMASLHTPDLKLDYSREGEADSYDIEPSFQKSMILKLALRARKDAIGSVTCNGRSVDWVSRDGVGQSQISLLLPALPAYHIRVVWRGNPLQAASPAVILAEGEYLNIPFPKAEVRGIADPQSALKETHVTPHAVRIMAGKGEGDETFFVHLAQGDLSWWQPVCFKAVAQVAIEDVEVTGATANAVASGNPVRVINNTDTPRSGRLIINYSDNARPVSVAPIPPHGNELISLPSGQIVPGRNLIRFEDGRGVIGEKTLIDWKIRPTRTTKKARFETIDLSADFNDEVSNIFRHRYLSPRPLFPTLQLPWQGIGNWCYPLVDPPIDDAGLRAKAGREGRIVISPGIPLATPGGSGVPNIIFTSRWDNFSDSANIPLSGRATHAYFLLAGSTDPMQSRITNGTIRVYYTDGSSDTLALNNPETWWPIEQDYFEDGFAFSSGAPRPMRVYLKTGEAGDSILGRTSIKGFSDTGIGGGAAVVMDMPLHADRVLDRLVLRTVANDVVIGLMSLTLLRKN